MSELKFASLHGGMLERRTAKAPPPVRPLLAEVMAATAGPTPGYGRQQVRPGQAVRPAPIAVPTIRSAPSPDGAMRKAMTLRLEPQQHRRLRLASANLGRSCQDILQTAMCRYLDWLGHGPGKGTEDMG
ncbi:MAG: hypothetical protein QF578_20295 [Alphaproteobacteria bacterium]|jgi:hypothetical protein|nr:hypothetical protein [Alphaproteobacteria bacterium]MDP6567181.1 hypothetical protein [Alphaproteobacteria bacterium]MDP6816215.1 hypothetical protein [Alphaproteobacteria bacterium]